MLEGYSLFIYNVVASEWAGMIILAKQTMSFNGNIGSRGNFDGAVALSAPGDLQKHYPVGNYANNWGGFVPLCGGYEDRSCNGCKKMPPAAAIEKAEKSIREHSFIKKEAMI